MSDFKSLLPPNRTQYEVDLERVNVRATDLPTPHRDLWNPATCPAGMLNLLAWAESVDVWNDGWPEEVKRAAIDASRFLHDVKATDGAVEDALSALGVDVDILHWHEQVPKGPNGTMKLTLWINDNINPDADIMIDSQMIRDLLDSVDRSKRQCIHYEFALNVEMHTGMRVAYSAESLALTHLEASQLDVVVDADAFTSSLGFSGESLALTHLEATQLDIVVDADAFVKSLGFSGESLALTHMEMTI